MVDLSEIQSAYYVIAATGVIGTLTAAFIAVRTYVNTNKRAEEARKRELETRQAQMFMNIYQQIITREFVEAWRRVYEESHWTNYSEFQELWNDKGFRDSFNIVGTYYEGIGVLVREELLPIRMVALLMCGMALSFWEKVKPVIVEARGVFGYSRFLSESEYLYGELMRYIEGHPELQTTSYKPI
jgi:hypothetical protein